MRGFLIFLALFCGTTYFIFDSISGSRMENFIIDNHEKSWAPKAMNHLSSIYYTLNQFERAEEILSFAIDIYEEDSEYMEKFRYEHFRVAANLKNNDEAIERGEYFLQTFP